MPSGGEAVLMKSLYRALVGLSIVMSVAATSASPGALFEPNATLVVPKTVISSKMRLVFAVGLEGTGHHYFVRVQDHLFQTNKHLVRIPARKIVRRSFYAIDHSMVGNPQHYNTELKTAREVMSKLAQRGAKLQYPGTVVSLRSHDSYPMGEGPNKALKYVDLRNLAEVAEDEGVDFRVLYLRRPVKDLLNANTIRRKFQMQLHNEGSWTPEENYVQYMQIILTDIAVMHSFLEELDPGFVVCHDYDRLGDVNQSAAIADILAPNAEVAELMKNSFTEVAATWRTPSKESLLYANADVVAARLQRKLDTFESQVCPGVTRE